MNSCSPEPADAEPLPTEDVRRALGHSIADFVPSRSGSDGRNLLERCRPMGDWCSSRLRHGLDAYGRVTSGAGGTDCITVDRGGRVYQGVNFASQDYLGLARHPAVVDAVIRTARDVGVHSAGSPALSGRSTPSRALEDALSTFLGKASVSLFPTGWAAGYGVIKALVGAADHIVIDVAGHACLQEGARSATRNVHLHPHLDVGAVERRLQRIRRRDPRGGILVVTETLFSMDSDTPDIASLQALCRQFDATLLVDCAHDLGAMGAGGLGLLGSHAGFANVDILVGSFSKTFASNGGFVASNMPALGDVLRCACGPSTFSNAISPIASAIVLACLEIVRSDEGDALRARLATNARMLRAELGKVGFEVLGAPSPLVPVVVGDQALSRLATRLCLELGGLVNLVEFPAVSRNSTRWRLQVMATHDAQQVQRMAAVAVEARTRAEQELAALRLPHAARREPMPRVRDAAAQVDVAGT